MLRSSCLAGSRQSWVMTSWRSMTAQTCCLLWSARSTAPRFPSSCSAAATSCTCCLSPTTAAQMWASRYYMKVSQENESGDIVNEKCYSIIDQISSCMSTLWMWRISLVAPGSSDGLVTFCITWDFTWRFKLALYINPPTSVATLWGWRILHVMHGFVCLPQVLQWTVTHV